MHYFVVILEHVPPLKICLVTHSALLTLARLSRPLKSWPMLKLWSTETLHLWTWGVRCWNGGKVIKLSFPSWQTLPKHTCAFLVPVYRLSACLARQVTLSIQNAVSSLLNV